MKKAIVVSVVVFFALAVFSGLMHNLAGSGEKAAQEAPKADPCTEGYDALSFDARFECAQKKHFSPWTGRHTKAVEALKSRLNDPGSLQIEATKFGLNEDYEEKQYYRVLMKFRAKNGFGGYMLSYAGASCDLKTGEVIDIQID